MVGRERELGRLQQAYRQAVEDRSCQLFTVLGPAGVGKSRLVAEFRASVRAEARVLLGRCLAYGEGITYWPVREIVLSAAGIEESASRDIALKRLVDLVGAARDAPTVAARIAQAIGLDSEPGPQEEIFWALRRLFASLAAKRPVVAVIDDIHWAESTMLDLIEHLADWSRDSPLLLLCTARPELLDARPSWGGGKMNATSILLEPLSGAASELLMDALLGEMPLLEGVRARIAATAEGNPLFVEEMVAMLRESMVGNGSEPPDAGVISIPPTIQALLAARLDRLPPEERIVAEHAAVVGRIFEQVAVAQLAPDSLRPHLTERILALVRKELVRRDHSQLDGDAFRFRHMLIRDGAYEGLPKAERADLHERFANWLGTAAGDCSLEYEEIVGYHLESACRYRAQLSGDAAVSGVFALRAATHLTAAGRRAFERGDAPAAAGLMSRAVELLPARTPQRLELQVELGNALVESGRLDEAANLLESTVRAAVDTRQRRTELRGRAEVLFVGAVTGSPGLPKASRTADATRALIEEIRSEGDLRALAGAHHLLAWVLFQLGRVAEGQAAHEAAVRGATEGGDVRQARRITFFGADYYSGRPVVQGIERADVALAAGGLSRLGEATSTSG